MLPGLVRTSYCIDHLLLTEDAEALYYDTVHDDDALSASDHMPIYCDIRL